MFKVVRQYPECRLFTKAVSGILKLAHKIDAGVLVNVTQTLQDSEHTMRQQISDRYEDIVAEVDNTKKKTKKTAKKIQNKFDEVLKKETNHPGFVSLMNKRLSIVYACIEISSTVAYIEELEEGISLRCLYQTLIDIRRFKFNFDNFKHEGKKSILTALEKLFLKKRSVSVECVASYIKLIADICVDIEHDAILLFCFLYFIKLSIIVKFSTLTLEISTIDIFIRC